MFEKRDKRYMTRGVSEVVPVELQLICWRLVDQLVQEKKIQVDYLQVMMFHLSKDKRTAILTHSQEEPSYEKQYEIRLDILSTLSPVDKIWLIDDGENQTMLLPEEY